MYTGLTGKVMIGKTTAADVAYISNWSVEQTTDMLEITQLGKVNKEKKPGLQSWSASADGAVCFDTANSHKTLFDAKKNGNLVTVKFYLNDSTSDYKTETNDVYFEGEGYIESLSVDLSAEDKGNISISISGDGELELKTTA